MCSVLAAARACRFSNGHRVFSLLRRCYCQHHDESFALENNSNKWSANVPPFGRLVVNVDTGRLTHVVVSGLDPHAYPLQDKALLTVLSNHALDKSYANLHCSHRLLGNGSQAEVVLTSSHCENKQTQDQSCRCYVEVPVKFDVNISVAEQCCVEVRELENDKIDIHVEQGSCILSKIRSQDISIDSAGGDVISKSVLQGNTDIVARKNANVSVDRVEGLSFSVHTEEGDVKAKALYADNSKFSSISGNLHLGSCHQATSVEVKGKGHLKIDSVDGDLTVRLASGDVQAFLLEHTRVDLETKQGHIKLKVLDSTDTEVEINSSEIEIDEDFDLSDSVETLEGNQRKLRGHLGGVNTSQKSSAVHGKSEKHIKLQAAKGKVSIGCQSWFDSLNLLGMETESDKR